MPSTRPGLTLDEHGLCNACRWYDQKVKVIDWGARKKELQAIAAEARRTSDRLFDCVVGVSGGKDSTWQAMYVLMCSLNPPLVQFAGSEGIDLGRAQPGKSGGTGLFAGQRPAQPARGAAAMPQILLRIWQPDQIFRACVVRRAVPGCHRLRHQAGVLRRESRAGKRRHQQGPPRLGRHRHPVQQHAGRPGHRYLAGRRYRGARPPALCLPVR